MSFKYLLKGFVTEEIPRTKDDPLRDRYEFYHPITIEKIGEGNGVQVFIETYEIENSVKLEYNITKSLVIVVSFQELGLPNRKLYSTYIQVTEDAQFDGTVCYLYGRLELPVHDLKKEKLRQDVTDKLNEIFQSNKEKLGLNEENKFSLFPNKNII